MTVLFSRTKPLGQLVLATALGLLAAPTARSQTTVTVGPDATFGTAGTVSTSVLGTGGTFSSVGTDTPTMYTNLRQMLVAGGYIWVCGPVPGSTGFVVKRYLPDGTLDSTFGTNGVVITSFGQASAASGLALQPDGKLVVVGQLTGTFAHSYAAARYTSTGVLDSTFGTNGLLMGSTSSGPTLVFRRVVVLPDGRLLAVGTPGSGSGKYFFVMRLSANGQPDTTFGTNGITSYGTYFQEVKQLADGRVLLVGTEYTSSSMGSQVSVRRLTAAGVLDTSFGTNGEALLQGTGILNGQNSAFSTEAFGVGVQPADDKIVLGGRLTINRYGDQAVLLRLLPDGTPDTAFNAAAANSLNGVARPAGLLAVMPQADGTILVGGNGYTLFGSSPQLLLARYKATGTLDYTFNRTGFYLQPTASSQVTAAALAVPATDQLLAWTGFEQLSGQTQGGMRLTRYRLTQATAVRPAADAVLQLQAAPVPTAGPVRLRYTLPTAAAVRLTLRDQLGRTVAAPAPAATQPAGSQELSLDVGQLANGLYLCTLQAGDLTQTVRLAVQK